MVMPYLSRLRPTATGLRPRPRSRFEPSPALPIDGPALGSNDLTGPPTSGAEPVDADTEFEPGEPHQPRPESVSLAESASLAEPAPPAESVLAATSPDRQDAAPVRTEAREPETRGAQQPPAYPATAAQSPPPKPRPPAESVAGISRHPAQSADAPVAAVDHEAHAARSITTRGPATTRQGSPERDPGEPPSRRAESPPIRASHDPAPAPVPAEPPPQPEDVPPPPADGPEYPPGRVPAIARWLGDGDARVDLATIEPAQRPAPLPQPPAPPPVPPSSHNSAHTDVSVTIGRIEVRAPATDAAPARRQASGPRRRPPSLDDYLASRTRARGRGG
jgi:hypothetical protein